MASGAVLARVPAATVLVNAHEAANDSALREGLKVVAPAGPSADTRLEAIGTGPARLMLPAPGGGWRLGGQTIGVRVRNMSTTRPLTVRLRVENADAKGLTDACQLPALIAAGESCRLELPIIARPEDPTYAPFKPFMMYFKNINVRDNTVDPASIVRLTIEIDQPAAGDAIEISPVTVSGTRDDAQPKFFPFVDRYGQYIHSNWAGKIRGDEDFEVRCKEEAAERAVQPGPKNWDRFGGWADGPKVEATGFFHTKKYEGKWWLVDPDGRLFWSYGPTGVGFGGDLTPITDREQWFKDMPARDDPQWGKFYKDGRGATYMYYEHDRPWVGYDVARANLVRKYGDNYESVVAGVSHERLRSWGFNSMGNWSDPAIYALHRTPYTVAIHYDGVPLIHSHMQDVFDQSWEPAVRASMARQKSTTAGDAWNLGYFIDNERWWGWRPRAAAVGEETLKNPPMRQAKIKFVEMLKDKYQDIAKLNEAWGTSHESWDALLVSTAVPDMKTERVLGDCGDFGMMFAERYFSVCKDAVKSVAPDNMYLGARFHGQIDKAVVALAGKYVDVVSYNIYDNPPDGRVNQYDDLDLPLMSTEWGVGSDPTQTPFRGADVNVDLTARARQITRYAEHAVHHPNMVGAHFFQYRDQPLTGRPDGEATLRGFVNIVDTPNFELVQTNRRIGEKLYEMRAGAK
jgi:hypothetical protein